MFIESLLIRGVLDLALTSYGLLLAYSGVYVLLGVGLLVSRRAALRDILSQASDTTREALFDRQSRPRGAD